MKLMKSKKEQIDTLRPQGAYSAGMRQEFFNVTTKPQRAKILPAARTPHWAAHREK
jgi:hypothetical protein